MNVYRVSSAEHVVLYDGSDGAVLAIEVEAENADRAEDVVMEFSDVPSFMALRVGRVYR